MQSHRHHLVLSLVTGSLCLGGSVGCASAMTGARPDVSAHGTTIDGDLTSFAHDGTAASTTSPPASARGDSRHAPHALPDVPTPTSFQEAEATLTAGLSALERDHDALAVVHLRAVLRSDFLTAVGRAQVYWAAAGAARRAQNSDLERDLLEGFLLTQETLPDTDETGVQTSIARGVLLARKIEDHGLGRHPANAIVVEDTRDTRSAVAALGCGENGDNAVVPVRESFVETLDARLIRRQVACTADGEFYDLWFDVSAAISANAQPVTRAHMSPVSR